MIFPLSNGQLCIRPFAQTDVRAFAEAALESVASIGPWMPWCHSTYAIDEARLWIENCSKEIAVGAAYDLGVFAADGKMLLGGVAINQISYLHNFGNIGYWVRQSCQRQGIATNAVRMMCDFGLRHLKLTRLEIVVAEQNVSSRAVAEKVGARFEGILRKRLMIRGDAVSAAMYSLVRD